MPITKVQLVDDATGNILYPETSADKVKLNSGKTVEEEISDINEKMSPLLIVTDVPDLGYDESDPHTIAELMGQSIEDVLAKGFVVYNDDVTTNHYIVVGDYGDEGGYITFIGRDKVYQYNVNADGYITDEQVTSLAPDDELSDTSENAVQNKVVKAAMDAMDAAKQDKDTNAIEGNVAVMDANGNSKGSSVPLDNVAKIDGQYDTLTSGYAGNLIDKSDAGSEQQIMFRKTGGATEVAASTRAMFKRLLGRSLVWNQVAILPTSDVITGGVTVTYTDGLGVCTGTTTAGYGYFAVTPRFENTVGRIYLFRLVVMEDANNILEGKTFALFNRAPLAYISQGRASFICENTATEAAKGTGWGVRGFTPGTDVTGVKFYVEQIDLTLMYGAGYEPATVAEYENVYNKPYYPHCTAEFIHNVAQTYEATGQNQWDEEWELGAYNDSGNPVTGSNTIRSKNYNKCLAGAEYYFKIPNVAQGSYMGNICWYDADKIFIKKEAIGPYTYLTRTSPANACYFRFTLRQEYGTVYNHDICINLSNADINGTYAPYVKATATLGLSAFRVKDGQGNITTVNGLKSAGDVYDEIDLIEKKYIKRIGVVDLGTLNYTYNSTLNVFANQFFEDSPTARRGLICQKYAAVKVSISSLPDKSIAFTNYYTGSIYNALTIKDSAYTDKNVFKAAMNGVLLYYELAEPVIYDLVDDVPEYSQVWGVGTENILPEGVDENGVPKTTPLRAVIYYPKDYTGIINNLPKNYISKDSLTNMLNALKSAGIIRSFTMVWNAETQTYNFTIS